MRAITFDIEAISPTAVRGRVNVDEMELTVVGIHDSSTGEYSSFFKDELPKLWPIIESSDMLIGFNSDTFDIPLLNRYYPGDLTKMRSLDILAEVHKVLGRRIRLDSLAQATLNHGKSGDGLKAMVWWQEGKYDLVKKYCIEDVRLTRELYDFARANGHLKYKDLNQKKDVKLDTSAWESEGTGHALTHTLGI